jgi:hypothetical protein
VAEIQVPSEQLDQAERELEQVLALLEDGGRPHDLAGALGNAPDVMDAAQNFDDRWSDGRGRVIKEGRDIQGKLEVLDAFTQTDDDLTKDM